MTTQNSSNEQLASFIEEICGESHLRVETDLGGGFVRLRISEAEKRQAAQDIRSSEDIVIEMLRNSRDAGASNIFVALQREGDTRSIVILDDGDGIPSAMHQLVFEPRVTSKLDSAHIDKWGMHGRGMALYSINQNAQTARVVCSDSNLGSSLEVITDLTRLSEKTDQSTFPVFELQESGAYAMRGPKNIIRTIAEFALEHRGECSLYCGSYAEICATLYEFGMKHTTPKERAFNCSPESAKVCHRLSFSSDPFHFVQLADSLGLEISERSARRIISGELGALPSILERLEQESFGVRTKVDGSIKTRKGRTTNLAKQDLDKLTQGILELYKELAEAYYLEGEAEVSVRQQGDCLKISIPLRAK